MSSISSTGRSERRPSLRHLGTLLALVVRSAWGTYAALDREARHAETRGFFLWAEEEWLQLFQPEVYEGQGAQWILLTGASEAREALLPGPMTAAFPGRDVLQASLSMGTMEGVLLMLAYIEEVYGPDAVPRRIVLGMVPRLLANYPPVTRTPIVDAIDRYGPSRQVVLQPAPHLEPAPAWKAVVAPVRYWGKQSRRFRGAMRVALAEAGRASRLRRVGSG